MSDELLGILIGACIYAGVLLIMGLVIKAIER